ncbi:MAG: YciI family protein [Candidatus Acidiferrales bacterium]
MRAASNLGDATSLRAQADGKLITSDGPYAEAKEHIGGFWVLELPDMDAAPAWGRKAVVGCRVPVEVHEFVIPR